MLMLGMLFKSYLYLSVSLKGFPIVPAITYAVARGLFFNDK